MVIIQIPQITIERNRLRRDPQVGLALFIHTNKQPRVSSGSTESIANYSVLNLAVAPPSTIMACPVMKDDCELSARK